MRLNPGSVRCRRWSTSWAAVSGALSSCSVMKLGLTPKLFSRVSRFQKVIQTAHALDDINWTRIALDCGYYDQAHFIHDFQAFAGITPSEYLGPEDAACESCADGAVGQIFTSMDRQGASLSSYRAEPHGNWWYFEILI